MQKFAISFTAFLLQIFMHSGANRVSTHEGNPSTRQSIDNFRRDRFHNNADPIWRKCIVTTIADRGEKLINKSEHFILTTFVPRCDWNTFFLQSILNYHFLIYMRFFLGCSQFINRLMLIYAQGRKHFSHS